MPQPNQPRSTESQREDLYLRWTRQCDAIHKRRDELLGLCDDLPTYEESMKGTKIKTGSGKEQLAFEDLPRMKENILKGLDGGIAALEKIEQECEISLKNQKQRLIDVRKRIEDMDLSEIPSSSRIDERLRNEFADFVNMRDGTRQADALRHQSRPTGPNSWETFTLDQSGFAKAQGLIRNNSRAIFDPTKAIDDLSDALIAFRNLARERQKEKMTPKIDEMKKIYDAAVRADKLADADRTGSLDIARPLENLKSRIDTIANHNADFWTARSYRDWLGSPLEEAYGYISKYGFERQLRDEERARNTPPVTEAQTKNAGAAPQRLRWLKKLFGAK
jgi:hypothetical protein